MSASRSGRVKGNLLSIVVAIGLVLSGAVIATAPSASAAPTQLTLSVSPPGGQAQFTDVTMTAVLTGTTSPMGHVVTFTLAGGITLGTATTDEFGEARLEYPFDLAGRYNIGASYAGDADNDPSTATPVTGYVISPKVRTSTSLTLTANPSGSATYPTGVFLQGTLAGPADCTGLPLEVYVDGVHIFSNYASNCTFAIPLRTLVVSSPYIAPDLTIGTHNIEVKFAGNADYEPSSGSVSNYEVLIGSPTLAITASPAGGLTLPGSVELTATLLGAYPLEGKTVTFTADTGTACTATTSPAGVAICSYTPPAAGVYTFGASVPADALHNAATATPISGYVVSPATKLVPTLSLVASPPGGQTFPGDVTLTATFASSSTVAGQTITFFVDGDPVYTTLTDTYGVATYTVPSPTAGPHSFGASYPGDFEHDLVTATTISGYVVSPAAMLTPTLSLAASPPGGLTLPGTVTLMATLSGVSTAMGQIITFSANGVTLGTATTDALGVALYTINNPAANSYEYGASFAGDNDHYSASDTIAAYVVSDPSKASTSLTLAADPAGGQLYSGGVMVTGALTGPTDFTGMQIWLYVDGVRSGLVTLNADGSFVVVVQTPSSVDRLSVGMHDFMVEFEGDSNYNGSTATLNNYEILMGAPTLTLTASPEFSQQFPGDVTLTATLAGATALAGQVITFTMDGVTLGTATTDPGGVATFVIASPAVGTHVYGASYAGDADNSPAVATPVVGYVVTSAATGPDELMEPIVLVKTGGEVALSSAALVPFALFGMSLLAIGAWFLRRRQITW